MRLLVPLLLVLAAAFAWWLWRGPALLPDGLAGPLAEAPATAVPDDLATRSSEDPTALPAVTDPEPSQADSAAEPDAAVAEAPEANLTLALPSSGDPAGGEAAAAIEAPESDVVAGTTGDSPPDLAADAPSNAPAGAPSEASADALPEALPNPPAAAISPAPEAASPTPAPDEAAVALDGAASDPAPQSAAIPPPEPSPGEQAETPSEQEPPAAAAEPRGLPAEPLDAAEALAEIDPGLVAPAAPEPQPRPAPASDQDPEAGADAPVLDDLATTEADAGAPSAAAAPEEAPETRRVSGDRVNLRAGPGTDTASLALLARGAEVEVLGEQNGWVRVRVPSGEEGWIASRFLSAG